MLQYCIHIYYLFTIERPASLLLALPLAFLLRFRTVQTPATCLSCGLQMSVRVKICGITSREDALTAVEAGADALGMMFYSQSPRHVSARVAAEITAVLPPFVAKVGVFVNPSAEEVLRAIAACGLDTLQFHGEETPEFCARFQLKVIKAFRIRGADSLRVLPAYRAATWLLDSYTPAQHGGTGATFNWDLAVEAKKLGQRILLAGGLTPENAAEAVRRVQPFALDVSSGVELAPGRKDAEEVRAFIRAAKSAGGFAS